VNFAFHFFSNIPKSIVGDLAELAKLPADKSLGPKMDMLLPSDLSSKGVKVRSLPNCLNVLLSVRSLNFFANVKAQDSFISHKTQSRLFLLPTKS